MNRISRTGWLATAWLFVVLGPLVGPPQTASSAEPGEGERAFDKQPFKKVVHGDFLYVGNTSLRCPKAGDEHTDEKVEEFCLAASERRLHPWEGDRVAGTNRNFFMQQANSDKDAGTFNTSRSQLTIPAGATITFAQLNWGGHTGRTPNEEDLHCTTDAAGDEDDATPPPFPAVPLAQGGPRKQDPQLRIGTTPIQVDASGANWRGAYTEDVLEAPDGQIYTNYQRFRPDDTSGPIQRELAKLRTLPTGQPLPVTVANVWTVSGQDCAAGWSLVLLYEFLDPNKAPAGSRHEVLVYNGHVKPQRGNQLATLSVGGFLADPKLTRIGLTTYEADWSPGGSDKFTVDRKEQAEPETGKATDFFLSDATKNDSRGQGMDPAYKHSFSVDAKTLQTGSIKADDQLADLTFGGEEPAYVVQNVTLSVPLPEVTITMTPPAGPVRPGGTAKFRVTVTNSSPVADAYNVTVEDPGTSCVKLDVGTLAAGKSRPFDCTMPVPADAAGPQAANRATVQWDSARDRGKAGVTASVPLIHPTLKVTRTATPSTVEAGADVRYKVVVQNTGDTAVRSVKVSDDTGCAKTIGNLARRQSSTIQCTDAAGHKTFTTASTATGTAPDGKPVMATGAATVAVTPARAALAIEKTADQRSVKIGTPVTFTVTVTNTGGVPLLIEVKDKLAPQCDMKISGAGLAAGAAQSQSCTVTPTAIGNLSNTATFTAHAASASGSTAEPISGSSETVTVQVSLASGGDRNRPPAKPADPDHQLGDTGGPAAALAVAAVGLLLSGLLVLTAIRRSGNRK